MHPFLKINVFAVQSFCKERDYKHIRRLSRQFRKWAKRVYFAFKKWPSSVQSRDGGGPLEADGGGGGGSIIINVPVVFYDAGRNDFDAGKSITRAIGRGWP